MWPQCRTMNKQSVSLNGIELHYQIEGEGEPLLLLHGGTGCHEDWAYAGRDHFLREYKLIKPDARGHGRSSNPVKAITHRQCAWDTLALLDHLGVERCRAIGLSMGGNILLHMAAMQPLRIDAMVVVSATMYFPTQAREIMRRVLTAETQPPEEWESMRQRHKLGDQQIAALWDWTRGMEHSYDDMNFTPPALSRILARTLIVYGDRDPLYPVEMAFEMYRAIPRSALWVLPDSGHGPVFLGAATHFAQASLAFLKNP
jgi:pimeloyl-ACP methyl ester carboxylesterase